MELLAPAGSKESFIAALEAGADAAYAGVPGFNARLNADALSFYDLEVMIDHARRLEKRVYCTFNILVKEQELKEAVKTLIRLEALGPDALIVQDPGVARIVRDHFPSLTLHASTQMACHNSAGVETLAGMGFTRAILARELSFAELKQVANKSPLELEIFCHGALCMSVSGMCLFSSWLGGCSGNRGRCTQPCRRLWESGDTRGYLFSPKDLELIEHVPVLKKLGIACLKIEGRMRSSEYVGRSVRAYRVMIDRGEKDFDAALKEAREILALDGAREKTTFLFSGTDPSLFTPSEPQCLGRRAGELVAWENGRVTVRSDAELKPGDRLRLADPVCDRTKTFTLKEFTRAGDRFTFALEGEALPEGTPLIKAGDASWDEKAVERGVDAMYRAYKGKAKPVDIPSLSRAYNRVMAGSPAAKKRGGENHLTLWVRAADAGWLDHLSAQGEEIRPVLTLSRESLHAVPALMDSLPFPPERIAVELTPWIGQRELHEYGRAIASLRAAGVGTWVLNNVGHLPFFPGGEGELVAGQFLYAWNRFACAALEERGVRGFTASWEEDAETLVARAGGIGPGRMIVYLFGHPALVRSRMTAGFTEGLVSSAGGGGRYRLCIESGSSLLLPESPVCLFHERGRLTAAGITHFGIDLTGLAPDAALWTKIYRSWREQKSVPGSGIFNCLRGVR